MISLTRQNGAYELALSAEPINEIGSDMLAGMEACLEKIRPQEGNALILYSTRPGGFSAGADLRELYRMLSERPKSVHEREMRSFLDRIHAVMDRLDTLPLTTIGVIHGVCFGGGFELALTCDVLVAEESARFCFPELRLGILPCFGGIPRLKRDVGIGVVRDLLLTGRSINAKKAQDLGLVSQVVAAGEGLNVARRLAQQALKFTPEAIAEAKRFVKPLPVAELREEKEIMLRLFQRPALQAALKKFVESTDVRPYLP